MYVLRVPEYWKLEIGHANICHQSFVKAGWPGHTDVCVYIS